MSTSNVSDAEIERAFLGTNFGARNHRKLLEASVLKKAVGYRCGHTITTIMENMVLISKKSGMPTSRGRAFLAHAFHEVMLTSQQ